MGKSHSAHTYISTESNFYSPGGTISGIINIHSQSAIPAGQLLIVLTGIQMTKWLDTIHHTAKSSILQVFYPIWDFQGTLNKGQFAIPFSLKPPSSMPPSFSYNVNDVLGSITYVLEAVVLDSSKVYPYQTIIWINSLPDQSLDSNKLLEQRTFRVNGCCCSKPGITELSVEIPEPAGLMGEEMNISVRIDNTQGKYRVKRLACNLVRYIRLKDRSTSRGYNRTLTEGVVRTHQDVNIPPGGSESSERLTSISIALKPNLQDLWETPSLESGTVDCEYKIEVALSFDSILGGGDYKVSIPVKIYNGMLSMNTQFTVPPLISEEWSPIELSSEPIHAEIMFDDMNKVKTK
jgi:hypothetical protein